MLRAEGFADDDMMGLKEYETHVMVKDNKPIGFFTICEEHGLPSLLHFCVARGHRSARYARQLIRHFCSIAGLRSKKAIVHAINKDYYKMIKHYFKKDPYLFKNGLWLFFVEV
jgi:hypothetical protein